MSTVQAAGGPAGTWATGIACQNLDNTDSAGAKVILTFYPVLNGTAITVNYPATIPMGGSMNWLTTSTSSMPGFPSGFTGSGVISSDKDLSCNVNTQSTGTGTQANPFRLGTAGAFSSNSGPVVYIPQAIKNTSGWNSYFAVQNTSGASTNVTVHYYDAASGAEITAAKETATIPANASQIFYQGDNTHLPDNYNASAKVTADDGVSTLVASIAIYRDATTYARSQFLSYNGVGAGSAVVYVPRFVRKLLGYNSGIAIQNVGTADTTATVLFTFNGVPYTVVTPPIHPNTSYTALYAPNITGIAAVDALPEGSRQGSAVVTVANVATDRIVVSVNEDNQSGTVNRLGQGSTYNAPAAGSETTTIFFAQFTKFAAGYFVSGFQVTNTTATAGTCNIAYVAGTFTETNVTLPASGSLIRYAPQIAGLASGYNGGVRVTCTQKVVGIVNLSASGNYYGDSFTQTTGLNQ